MASDVRSKMVESAVILLAKHGLQATSFSEVLDASGAPRGSIYHHFPEGKDQLVAAAIALAGERAVGLLESMRGQKAEQITLGFLGMWRALLTHGKHTVGCSVLAVTIATDSSVLLAQAAGIFRSWSETLASLLEEGGLKRSDASSFATLLIAASEGAVVLARAQASTAPFDVVAGQLVTQVRRLAKN